MSTKNDLRTLLKWRIFPKRMAHKIMEAHADRFSDPALWGRAGVSLEKVEGRDCYIVPTNGLPVPVEVLAQMASAMFCKMTDLSQHPDTDSWLMFNAPAVISHVEKCFASK